MYYGKKLETEKNCFQEKNLGNNFKSSMQSMMLITWASKMSKEQDKLLCDFKLHVDDPLEADPQFFGHSSRDNVLSSVSCGPSHKPAMAAACTHSTSSVSRVTL